MLRYSELYDSIDSWHVALFALALAFVFSTAKNRAPRTARSRRWWKLMPSHAPGRCRPNGDAAGQAMESLGKYRLFRRRSLTIVRVCNEQGIAEVFLGISGVREADECAELIAFSGCCTIVAIEKPPDLSRFNKRWRLSGVRSSVNQYNTKQSTNSIAPRQAVLEDWSRLANRALENNGAMLITVANSKDPQGIRVRVAMTSPPLARSWIADRSKQYRKKKMFGILSMLDIGSIGCLVIALVLLQVESGSIGSSSSNWTMTVPVVLAALSLLFSVSSLLSELRMPSVHRHVRYYSHLPLGPVAFWKSATINRGHIAGWLGG